MNAKAVFALREERNYAIREEAMGWKTSG